MKYLPFSFLFMIIAAFTAVAEMSDNQTTESAETALVAEAEKQIAEAKNTEKKLLETEAKLEELRKQLKQQENKLKQREGDLETDLKRLLQQQKSLSDKESALQDRLSAITDQETALSDKLAASETALAERTQILTREMASLKQREADLKKSRAALETEKTAWLKQVREKELVEAQARQALLDRLAKPEQLALEIFNILLPKNSLNSIKSDITSQRDAMVAKADFSQPIQNRIDTIIAEFDSNLDKSFDYNKLRNKFIDFYANNYTPQELLNILEFYQSSLGTKLLSNAANLNRNLQASLKADATALLHDFKDELAEFTGPSAVENLIKGNLNIIVRVGQRYLVDENVPEVRVAELVSQGYLQPITPIYGESYSRVKITNTGGVAAVTTDSGEKIFVKY